MRRSTEGLQSFLALCVSVYMMSVGISALYFNWQFARTNGFARWVLLGEIVPTAKAFVWPYFAFHGSGPAVAATAPTKADLERTQLSTRQIAEMEVKKAILAVNYAQQGAYLLNSKPHENLSDYPNLPEIVADRRKAVAVGTAVDPDVLNGVFPQYGDRFKNDFLQAMTLFIEGAETTGPTATDALRRSKQLNDKWADWYVSNRKAIEDAANKAIGAE